MTIVVLVENGAVVSGPKIAEDRPALAGLNVANWLALGWHVLIDVKPNFDAAITQCTKGDIVLVKGEPTQLYVLTNIVQPDPVDETPDLQTQVDALKKVLIDNGLVTDAAVTAATKSVGKASVNQIIN